MDVFPLPAGVRYDYAQRFSTAKGGHRGTDIFAALGTPVLAVEHGTAQKADDPKGGRVVYLRARSGARYYYAHLDEWIGDFPREVIPGEPIGTVGQTGNAARTPAHLHFQISPAGGGVIDPYPELVRVDLARETKTRGPFDMGPTSMFIALALLWWVSRN